MSYRILIVLVCIVGGAFASDDFLMTKASCNSCDKWHSKVDPEIAFDEPSKSLEKKEKATDALTISMSAKFSDAQEFFKAAECLLKLEGRSKKARIFGATRSDVSQTFDSARIDVAALYYISYIFYERWDHAGAIALLDEHNNLDDDEIVKRAFSSYRKWLAKVRELGLESARRKKLDPLADSGISWY